MATMALTIGALSATWTISPEDINRILASIRRDHGQVPDGSSPPTGAMRDLTSQECFNIVASRLTTWLNEMNKSSERIGTPIEDIAMTPN